MRLASRDRRVRPKASLPPGSRYESQIMLPLLSTKSEKIGGTPRLALLLYLRSLKD